jgi:hypothetical protein
VLPIRKHTSVARTPTPDLQAGRARSEDSHTPTPPLPQQPRKLRKARKDGYESDGGYLSDNSKKKKKDKKDQKKVSESSFGPEYQSDGEHLSDLTKSGVDKKKKQKDKGSKMSDDLGANSSIKTSNVSIKKSRIPSDDGDVSDGGYLSEATGKKKRSFFSRRSRSPSTTRKGLPSDAPPPVPTLPPTPIPTSEDFTRSPNFSNLPDSSSLNGGTPIWASHRTVPPSLDERSDSNSSLQRRDRSSSPLSDNIRGTIRSWSVDTSSEKLTASTASHEFGRNSPAPHALPWEATSYIPRPHKPEPHPRSEAQPHEQVPASASATSRPYGVRFTASTRFDSSEGVFPTPPSSPAVMITSEGSAPRPKIIIPDALKASPSPGPHSPVPPVWRNASPMSAPLAPQPFLSRSLRSTPSLGTLTPPVPRGVSPAFSESSVISSSDFIVRSPRPRFFEDLPPPSPPPTGPLPEVPSHGPYSHLVPQIRRGRQSPFPTQGILPVQEVSRLIERTERRRMEAQVGIQPESMDGDINNDVHDGLPQLTDRVVLVPPSPPHSDVQGDEYDWRDDESVRPDIAQFYFYESPSSSGISTSRVAPDPSPDEPDDLSSYKFPFVQSFSSENLPPSPMTPAVPSGIHRHYFEHGRDGGGEDGEGRSQFFDDDDENPHVMRTRFVARVADAFHGAEKTRPVPKLLRPF